MHILLPIHVIKWKPQFSYIYTSLFAEEFRSGTAADVCVGELNSPGKLTTWSNIGSGGAGGSGTQIRTITGKAYIHNYIFVINQRTI